MLFEYLDLGIEPCFREVAQRVHEFDASPTEKGNGYRSLLRIVQKCCLHLLQLSRYIAANKDSMLFRRYFYMKELEAYVATLGQLRACLYYAQKLMTYCQPGCLFADEETLDNAVAEQLMIDVEMLSQDCFYGRCLGFQFCESMQRPLQVVAIAMASFAEGYQENSQIMKVATSLFNSGKYLMNPDLRAQQVVNVTRTADIQFCKAFWSITETEIMHQLPSMVCPAVQVDEVFHLGPDAFDMPSADGKDEVTITPPCAHTGPAPVQVRLISHQLREGQEQHLKSSKLSPSSRSSPQRASRSHGLVVHCHGGGFVAQSSRSHEVYLRHWAKELDVPILSIDYSLAPESPFPRALEECFYVYAWAVHNCDKLGSTGEVICMAGDSAGGNLIVSTAMRAASFNIRRPDGILGVYTPVLVRYTPSPARLLCLMDPLLPAGILSRCLAAYAGVSDELSSQLAASVNCHIESSAATLRMSSQESAESDWVVVSQDAAASTNTTLAQPQQQSKSSSKQWSPTKPKREMSMESVDEENGSEEIEIFSRPRMTAASVASTVAGARDRFVSYVGSYTQMLTKNFMGSSSGASSGSSLTPDEFSLNPLGASSSGSLVDQEVSSEDETTGTYNSLPDRANSVPSLEHSPCTPSYHTPLTSPAVAKGLPHQQMHSCESMNASSDASDLCHTSISVDAAAKAPVAVVMTPADPQQGSTAADSIAVESDSAANNSESTTSQTMETTTAHARETANAESDSQAKSPQATVNTAAAGQSDLEERGYGDSGDMLTATDGLVNHPEDHFHPYDEKLLAEKNLSADMRVTEHADENQGHTCSGHADSGMEKDRASEPQESSSRGPQMSSSPDEGIISSSPPGENCSQDEAQPHSFMPSLAEDKAELLQLELAGSVNSGTDSATLPSSLLSTPSDDLNSYEILGEGQVKLASPLFTAEGSCSEIEKSNMETNEGEINQNSSLLPGRSELCSPPRAGPSPAMFEIPLLEDDDVSCAVDAMEITSDGASVFVPKMSTSCDEIAKMRSLSHAHKMSHVIKSQSSTALPTSNATRVPKGYLLPESDQSSVDGEKSPIYITPCASQSSYFSPVLPSDSKMYLPSTSRSNMKLDLRQSASTSSMPRSASVPVFGEGFSSRTSHGMSPSDFKRERHLAQSPMHAIRNIPIVKNPYMSPLLAPDWLLQGLPHICLVACHLDPLLDDSIMFTRRLRSLGKSVDLLLIDDLPHGFLNFSLASKDAKHASDLCVAKLKQLLYPGDTLS